jgi:hypothetical protein
MANKSPWGDVGDEFLEIIEQTGKGVAQTAQQGTAGAVKQVIDTVAGTTLSKDKSSIEQTKAGEKNTQNFTQLSPDKLAQIGDKFKSQDDIHLEQLRNRLFNIVKGDEKGAYQEAKQKEQERIQKMREEDQQPGADQNNMSELPQMSSKAARGMTAKKAIKSSSAETKANSSKQ